MAGTPRSRAVWAFPRIRFEHAEQGSAVRHSRDIAAGFAKAGELLRDHPGAIDVP
ncbi:MAG TPA: hypothetical protein VMU69_25090 [Bradyrhizobium sp.]|nr:hypothetical protein [Bradyrhizobium sp.]